MLRRFHATGTRSNSAVRLNPCRALPSAREHLDQAVEILLAVEERFYQHAFVPAVDAHIVDVAGEAGMAVGRYPGIAQIAAVGCAGAHGGDDRRARPEL